MNKIAFLDRDGVINNDTGHYYIYKPEDFVLNPEVIQSLKLLVKHGYLLVIITNQGGIARGTYTKKDVDKVHFSFKNVLKKAEITLTEIYYCPHHNEFENCLCRKPHPLMIEKALARFNGDRGKSFMIGDNLKDVESARNAHIRGFKIDKNTSIYSLVKDIIDESI